jgi:flagellar protein FlbD
MLQPGLYSPPGRHDRNILHSLVLKTDVVFLQHAYCNLRLFGWIAVYRVSPVHGPSPSLSKRFGLFRLTAHLPMIKLTRLDGQGFVLNADLIRFIETRPDTFVTLVSGERIVVKESMETVVDLSIDYQQRKSWIPNPTTSRMPLNCAATAVPLRHSGICE